MVEGARVQRPRAASWASLRSWKGLWRRTHRFMELSREALLAEFTRIAKEPIREQGVIVHPNVVIVG